MYTEGSFCLCFLKGQSGCFVGSRWGGGRAETRRLGTSRCLWAPAGQQLPQRPQRRTTQQRVKVLSGRPAVFWRCQTNGKQIPIFLTVNHPSTCPSVRPPIHPSILHPSIFPFLLPSFCEYMGHMCLCIVCVVCLCIFCVWMCICMVYRCGVLACE